MKYLTKKWYETMQKTDMHLLLKISKKAETFSEEYYNNLYEIEEKNWIKLHKDTSGITDIKQLKKEFKQLQENNIKSLKKKLPTSIINKVADIRVLALNRVSDTVKEEIIAYCQKQNIKVEKQIKDYAKYCNSQFKNKQYKALYNQLHLHDALITNIIKGKDKLIMELYDKEEVKNISFEHYTIIEEEMNFINSYWLYEELYYIDNKYELHILLNGQCEKNMNLGYFTIRANNIKIKKKGSCKYENIYYK